MNFHVPLVHENMMLLYGSNLNGRALKQAFHFSLSPSCDNSLALRMKRQKFVFYSSSRLFFWKATLYAVAAMLLFFIPKTIAQLAIRKLRFSKCHCKLCLFILANRIFANGLLSFICRVGVIGVLIVAALAGFGAISCLYTSLPFPEDYPDKVERQIGKTIEMIAAKKFGTFKERQPSSFLSFYTEVFEDVKSLEAFNERLFMELAEINAINQRKEYARTFRGKYFLVLGYFLSLLSIWKIFSSIINIVFDRYGTVDPVTRVIGIAVHYMGFDFDVKLWSQHFSFVFVGCLSLSSVRSLLVSFAKFFIAILKQRATNRVNTNFQGMYLLSTVLLVRMSMPPEYRWIITEVFGDLAYPFYQRWFDEIFILSAIASTVFFAIVRKKYDFNKCE
ncbi:DUF3735 and ABA GPCR domain containing protein [Trichuris trichiura]|uniref:DUF3735 and ABA GPCR domain containing protein n=1 Tax=Trichuris trichiura TaxID=36087 RepID=A0A077Z6F9_TRITR|nr:DUF3735 and ABA GPCR domain containing protein [Trichuris trichiura]